MEEEKWYFTFGCGQLLHNHYIIINGSFSEARKKMYEQFGSCWSNQYSESQWKQEDNLCRDYVCIGEF